MNEKIDFLKSFFAPYTKRVYLVGGSVRDMILSAPTKDLDIEVFGVEEEKFDLLMDKLGAKGVGKSFFVYKWEGIDISLPRIETKVAKGHRGFNVSLAKDEKTASKRRDFTMNAMMQNIYSGEIIDFWGGMEDLKSKTIRVVNERSFTEDSLRVLRAVRFASRFGQKIEKRSMKLIGKMDLSDLSMERVSNELQEIFKSSRLEIAFFYFCKIDSLREILGITFDKKLFLKIVRIFIKYAKNFDPKLYEYYFLYIINSFVDIDIDKLMLPNRYKKIITSHAKLNFNVTNRELAAISIDRPIKEWLGAISDDIIKRAKDLNIYEQTIECNVSVQDVIRDGFEKEEIKKELLNRKLKYINDRICQ